MRTPGFNGFGKNRKRRIISHSSHENINRIVQLYAGILSDILLGKSLLYDLKEVRNAIGRVNHLILKHPGMVCYTKLKSELVHLKNLISEARKSPDNINEERRLLD